MAISCTAKGLLVLITMGLIALCYYLFVTDHKLLNYKVMSVDRETGANITAGNCTAGQICNVTIASTIGVASTVGTFVGFNSTGDVATFWASTIRVTSTVGTSADFNSTGDAATFSASTIRVNSTVGTSVDFNSTGDVATFSASTIDVTSTVGTSVDFNSTGGVATFSASTIDVTSTIGTSVGFNSTGDVATFSASAIGVTSTVGTSVGFNSTGDVANSSASTIGDTSTIGTSVDFKSTGDEATFSASIIGATSKVGTSAEFSSTGDLATFSASTIGVTSTVGTYVDFSSTGDVATFSASTSGITSTVGTFVDLNSTGVVATFNASISSGNTTIRIDGNDYIVNNPGCKIPLLDPLDPSVKHLIQHVPDLNCEGLSYITVENNTLWVNAVKDVICFAQSIYRKDEDNSELGNSVRLENGSMPVLSEFLKVECKIGLKSKVVYRQFYPIVIRKAYVEKRTKNYRRKHSQEKKDKFRVVMLGLDSVSKNQFLRHMTKTFDFMKQKLTYAEIHGYNKIGKNTHANILPMLTGLLEDEVPDMSDRAADVLPFIWNRFMDKGYKTLFSEDSTYGAIFNYGLKGFAKQPVDYYLRPWSLARAPYMSEWKTGCLNEKLEANVILKYMEDLLNLFPKDPVFAFTFLTFMSHDDLNGLGHHDKPVRDFMEKFYKHGHVNNTIMFFFGDHGFRFGGIRATYVGRMEGRLPFMFIITPPSFPTKYRQMFKNLKTNEKRLVTPLDIHATLKDILSFDGEGFEDEGSGRSISLLKYLVPVNRTCRDASIKNQWCACVKNEPISVDDDRVKKSALEIVRKINKITQGYRKKCAKLSLVSIRSASKQVVGVGEDSENANSVHILVTILVSPSKGIFEGTVWFDGESSYLADNTIERINLYKKQSACVDRHVLKPYCFCKV